MEKETTERLKPEEQSVLLARLHSAENIKKAVGILCLLLYSLSGGDNGQCRGYFSWYSKFIPTSDDETSILSSFVTEAFQYYFVAGALLQSHPDDLQKRQIKSPQLIGVADGLLYLLFDAIKIRNRIRESGPGNATDSESDEAVRIWRQAEAYQFQERLPGSRGVVQALYIKMIQLYAGYIGWFGGPNDDADINPFLDTLNKFHPRDPCQSVLLLPCFIVGAMCTSKEHQNIIQNAIGKIFDFTGRENTKLVILVLKEIWDLVSCGDMALAWDWPGVSQRLGLDFVPA